MSGGNIEDVFITFPEVVSLFQWIFGSVAPSVPGTRIKNITEAENVTFPPPH